MPEPSHPAPLDPVEQWLYFKVSPSELLTVTEQETQILKKAM